MRKSIIIPLVLAIYLAVMARIGWRQFSAGEMTATYYFGIIAISLAVIVLLYFSLRRRERLRERGGGQDDADGGVNKTTNNNNT